GLSLYQVVRTMQTLLATWAGTCPTCHRDIPTPYEPDQALLDVEEGSWAALAQEGDTWTVRQGGPECLWDAIEDKVTRWRTDGAPPLEEFEVIITPEGQAATWAKV
ncbi:hypothetical protein ACH41H_35815, partial [Streptomyces sp. NPDC020800]